MTFRSDINGLRALAIIAVVIFHFFPLAIPSGFAGVDIFFVLSGFLMTSIIITQLKNNRFKLIGFYSARANRIIPALFVLCLCLVVLGYFYLIPFDFKALCKHIFSSMGFISNYVYLSESGYFDSSSHNKWLLHTWSLSAEWQFYILYPVILSTLFRFTSFITVKNIVITLFLASLLFSIYQSHYNPDSAYFSLLSRAWQMLSGALVFFYSAKFKFKNKEFWIAIGLALCISSLFIFSSTTIWPGLASFIPIAGTCIILLANKQHHYLLSNKVFQNLGNWSYSIYLWHWPIAAFCFKFGFTLWYNLSIGILFSVILGALSYTFVEKRKLLPILTFRELHRSPPAYMLVFLCFISFYIWFKDGLIDRVNPELRQLNNSIASSPYRESCHISSLTNFQVEDACEYFENDVTWAVIGDSHSVEIAYSLATLLKPAGIGLKHFTFSACPPSYQSETTNACSSWYNQVSRYLLGNDKIQNIVIAHRYSLANKAHEKMTTSLSRFLEDIANVKANIYIYTPVPSLETLINNLIGKAYVLSEDVSTIVAMPITEYRQENKATIEYFQNTSFPKNVHVLQTSRVFCDNINCYATKANNSLYLDDNHPSLFGAELMVELIGLNLKK